MVWSLVWAGNPNSDPYSSTARFLANDMEEEASDPKCVIFPWALGQAWQSRVSDFLHQRDQLWAQMDFRAAVSRQSCEEVNLEVSRPGQESR